MPMSRLSPRSRNRDRIFASVSSIEQIDADNESTQNRMWKTKTAYNAPNDPFFYSSDVTFGRVLVNVRYWIPWETCETLFPFFFTMPPKQIQLQSALNSQEQWDDYMASSGLQVVDVYSTWCGPCKAVLGLFRRIKNELGDDLLKFATAEADVIDSLEKYRNKSQPTFLFWGGGLLQGVVRGSNGPLLQKTITNLLEREHKIIDGNEEREEFIDEVIMAAEAKDVEIENEEEKEKTPSPQRKEVTVAIIKPDAVAKGLVDEILEKVAARGLEVLAHEERILTREEVEKFYSQHQGSDSFEQLLEFMSSGPCHVLILTKGETGENAIPELRSLIGPTDSESARQEAPDTLRAMYGKDNIENAVHACDSSESAARELAFFFPNFRAPWVAGREPVVQKTFALIRPDAARDHRGEIISKIKEAGFVIALEKEMQLTPEMVEEFYSQHKDKDWFPEFQGHMTSGPVLALGLAHEDAVEKWREMIGPKDLDQAKEEAPDSLRAQFSNPDGSFNSVHGADSTENAEKELDYFFPMEKTVAVIKPEAIKERESIVEKIREAGFDVALQKEKHLTKDLAEQFYSQHKDKEFFNDLTEYMSEGPSLFMVLSRRDAITGWRAMIGPTDPAEAKDAQPDSLRAIFGVDKMRNAVHGSSTAEHAESIIKTLLQEEEEEVGGGDVGEDKADKAEDKADKVEEREGSDEPKEEAAEAEKTEGEKEEPKEDPKTDPKDETQTEVKEEKKDDDN
ncbi:thioredoxin domain-containing protein 6-like [Oscarella lobularis]|uniref:thioredoxin domain-containing protein 6-like n=1 Tax=Oscarella lobularis TaxID=121494 RepID=UPI003313A8E0